MAQCSKNMSNCSKRQSWEETSQRRSLQDRLCLQGERLPYDCLPLPKNPRIVHGINKNKKLRAISNHGFSCSLKAYFVCICIGENIFTINTCSPISTCSQLVELLQAFWFLLQTMLYAPPLEPSGLRWTKGEVQTPRHLRSRGCGSGHTPRIRFALFMQRNELFNGSEITGKR